jgi:hypothetical protein
MRRGEAMTQVQEEKAQACRECSKAIDESKGYYTAVIRVHQKTKPGPICGECGERLIKEDVR